MGPESVFNGLTLVDFFNGNNTVIDFEVVSSGSIDVYNSADASSRFQLVDVFVGVFAGGWTINDFAFFENVTLSDVYFFDNQVALAGGATVDLSLTQGLAAVGTTGDIVIGLRDENLVVGQWEIVGGSVTVPVPTTMMLFAIGLVGLGWLRKKA